MARKDVLDKLKKSFIAINISEVSPQLFGPVRKSRSVSMDLEQPNDMGIIGGELEEDVIS